MTRLNIDVTFDNELYEYKIYKRQQSLQNFQCTRGANFQQAVKFHKGKLHKFLFFHRMKTNRLLILLNSFLTLLHNRPQVRNYTVVLTNL